MNSVSINLHDYYSKLVNLHNHVLINVSHFQIKLGKFYTLFHYTPIGVSTLKYLNFEFFKIYTIMH